MSALAISFDPTFALESRSPFTWPAGSLDSSPSLGDYLSPDFTSLDSASEPSLTSPSISSSLCSSPPRYSFTPQQRELKRQRDRARRDSRLTSRLRRVSNKPSYMDPSSMPVPDVTSAMDMPILYSTAAAPMSLLTEPYMPSYSPPLDPSQSHMFPTPHGQSLQQNYGMPMEYQPSQYTSSGLYNSRASSLSLGHPETGMMYQMPAVMRSGGSSTISATTSSEDGQVRVVQSRPKPRCWEHGCNGRQFSTFSNLLRHQREKSGQATKSSCPNCGAEFTRTTARNGHMLHDKCKRINP